MVKCPFSEAKWSNFFPDSSIDSANSGLLDNINSTSSDFPNSVAL